MGSLTSPLQLVRYPQLWCKMERINRWCLDCPPYWHAGVVPPTNTFLLPFILCEIEWQKNKNMLACFSLLQQKCRLVVWPLGLVSRRQDLPLDAIRPADAHNCSGMFGSPQWPCWQMHKWGSAWSHWTETLSSSSTSLDDQIQIGRVTKTHIIVSTTGYYPEASHAH